MGILPEKYEKYISFFKFILKYRNDDIFLEDNQEEPAEAKEWEHSPEELVEDLKKMGPTYIKLGQLLSTRSDLLPEPFLEALATLQDDVESVRSEEHTSELQSRFDLVCRLLLAKKNETESCAHGDSGVFFF